MSKAVNSKWKKTFPDTIGNQNRPATGVDDTQPFETGGFPQYMANDPVRYDLQNAAMSQSMSNDARLKEMVDARGKELDDHKVDPGAHKTGIAGNAATATKLATPRAISLTGNASGSANFDGSGNVSINATVNESKHAAAANALNSMGNKTAIKDGTREPLNLSLYQVYNNGYPVPYGNLLSIGGAGGGELLAEWSDGDKGIGHLYYRNRKDTDYLWSDWRTVAFTSDINSFAPTKTGAGASGTWPISVSGNATTATKANTATNATNATNADKVDGYHENSFLRYRGAAAATEEDTLWSQIGIKEYDGKLPKGISGTYNYGSVVSLPGISTRLDIWYNHQCSANKDGLWYRSGYDTDQKAWARLLDSNNYTNWAPTKTGVGASGTWNINISGNADSATNADKVNGYHAADLLRTLGGNRTPVITDIFDRAGTIDMSTMSAADKATHKANINKAENMTQNLWNDSMGIHAYGGDYDIAGYNRGALKLTQSYKNFDKILVVITNDDANWVAYCMWDVWELDHAFANSYRFNLSTEADIQWNVYGTARHDTTTDYPVSTDTIWDTQDQNSGIIAIYGIKF